MTAPVFKRPPALLPPRDDVPLVAMLDAPLTGAERLRVRITQSSETWTLEFPADDTPYLLTGFLTTGMARIVVQASGPGGVATGPEELEFTPQGVPKGPLDLPPFTLVTSDPGRMSGAFTFLSIRHRAIGRVPDLTPAQRRFTTGWGMLVAIDHQARIRWMKKLDNRPAGLYRLSSGNIFVHDTEFCSREFDLQGNAVNAYYAEHRPQGPMQDATAVPVQSLHHQPHQMPNGNFLAVSGHSRLIKDWPASVHEPEKYKADKHVVGDKIVEFDRDGRIVWEWDSFDHLDPYRIGYDALDAYWHVRGFPDHGDWTHCNGVTYDDAKDTVIVSFRLQDAVIGIDRSTSEIKWILGDHTNWRPDLAAKLLTPVGEDFRWPWHGHNPRVTSEGTIVMFDNGIYQARPGQERVPFERSFTRGVEFRVDEDAMTVEQVWASARTEDEVMERTWAMGDSHRLEDSDTALVVHSISMPHGLEGIGLDEDDRTRRFVAEYPSYARIVEMDRKTRDIVFDAYVRDPDEIIQWEAFSAVRAHSLYPGPMGVTWHDGDALIAEPAEA